MFSTLPEWLDWLSSKQTERYLLGLERVYHVGKKLGVLAPSCPVITVAGTNGKGSTVQGLASIYQAAGYKVGTFTSPIMFRHNEQVRINNECASDQAFVEAFQQVEQACGQVKLTPFEYQTLAALLILKAATLEVMILEVGLGGRLDAVNVVDPTISVVTTIHLDHCEYLGATREEIAIEKAGVFRQGTFAVCGDPHPPVTLFARAEEIGARLVYQGRDFHYKEDQQDWCWQSSTVNYENLPRNGLATQNMSTALMVVTLLQDRLPVSLNAIRQGLENAFLCGRFQVIPNDVTEIYDVAHNVESVERLAMLLKRTPCQGKTIAIFSMLKDKDILGSLAKISTEVDEWVTAPVKDRRATTKNDLANLFQLAGIIKVTVADSLEEAHQLAKLKAKAGDRIVVFGSFRTVVDVMRPWMNSLS